MENKNPFKRLFKLLSLEKDEITSIYFFAILSGILQLSLPVGVQSIIGFVLGASMVTSIYVLIVVVVAGVLIVGVMQINQMKIIEKIQQNIFTRYAFEFAEVIPRIDLKKANQYYLPEKMNRFFDTLSLQKGLSKLLLDIPTASIQILLGLILLSLYHPIFIAFGVILIFVLWLILKITSKQGLITSLLESDYKYAVVAWFEEMARIIKSFKFSHGSNLNLKRTDANLEGYLTARTAHFKILIIQYKSLVLFKGIITAAMLIVGTYLLIHQQLNIGEFIAAEIVILTVIGAVEKLIGSLDSVYDVMTGLEKLASVVEIQTEKDGKLRMNTDEIGPSIELINLNFEYLDGKKVLNDINLSIPSGNKVCVFGVEGSGKSTFLQLLNGNYTSFSGSILINRLPIGNYELETFRSAVGCYSSEQGLFKGTVWENISLGRAEVTPEKITVIAEKLGIQNYLNKLPDGFETEIDASGEKLPASTVKKILLLRAFSNSPKLLLLEEPWLGFDEILKQRISHYILTELQNVTVVVLSSDPMITKKCDIVIELENGHANIIKKVK